MVISGLQVGSGATRVSGLANSRRAGLGVATRVRRQDREAVLGELGVSTHVDARQIPEDGVSALGVLELEDIGLAGVGGQLDGDTTAVRVGLPVLTVGTTIGGQGLHGANVRRNGPGVHVLVQVVGNQDGPGSRNGVVAADQHARRKGRGHSGEGGSQAECLSEHHLDLKDCRT